MTQITPGTNATIKADSVEEQLFYCLLAVAIYENSSVNNPDKVSGVSGTLNIKDQTFNMTFDIPCLQSKDEQGRTNFTAVNYLKNVPFQAGNPLGTFKSTNLLAYLVELIMYAQYLENDNNVNPRKINNITAGYDSDRQKLTGTAKIPCDILLNAEQGNGLFVPKEYLA